MTDTNKVELDRDVADWLSAVLFPPPESGRQGVTVNGVPGTPEFDTTVDLFTRAKTALTST